MPKKKKHEEEHENEERWLLTYADLITLLMAFFLVMFAMSRVDAEKFKSLSISLSDAFNGGGSPLNMGSGAKSRSALVSRPPRDRGQGLKSEGSTGKYATEGSGDDGDGKTGGPHKDIEKLRLEFLELVKEGGLESTVTVKTNPQGNKLIVQLSDSLLFDVGKAKLTGPAEELMHKVAAIVAKSGKHISIEGHTDNVPIRSGRYESNWQLSTDRATNVLMYLIDHYGVPPELLSASGYGEYRPISPNDTPENRAKNRRVEFVIMDGPE